MLRRTMLWTLVPAALTAGLVVANCTGQMANGEPGVSSVVAPACDPDGYAPCPDDAFVCVEDGVGNKRCEGQRPAVPDEGEWQCYEEGTTLVCRGDHLPGDDGFWDCEQLGDSVICRGHAYVPTDDGGEGGWDCWYEGEYRVCESGDGGSSEREDGPSGESSDRGGGGGFWDDWFPDGADEEWLDELEDFFDDIFDGGGGGSTGGEEDGGGCLCIPGAVRYCDTPTYCRWGIQTCGPRGLRWGPCVETSIPAECAAVDSWYSPEAEACCVEAGFCCQDMWDLDRDGDTWESVGDCVDIVCA